MSEREAKDLLLLYGVYKYLKRGKKKTKRLWMRNLVSKREKISHTVTILPELDPNDFRNYLRMDEETYTYLLSLVSSRLTKCDTRLRKAITPHEQLSATLRFLATGRTLTDLTYSCAISQPSLSYIIPHTCQIIYNVLVKDVMKVSSIY